MVCGRRMWPFVLEMKPQTLWLKGNLELHVERFQFGYNLDILDLFQFFVCLQRQGQVRWLTFISATKNYSDVKTKNVGSRISWEWLRPRQDFAIRLPKWEPIYVCVSWKFNLIKDFKPVANLQSFRNFNIVPHAISIFLHFFKWDKRNQLLNF